MTVLKWSDSISSGIGELDKQHKTIIELFNAVVIDMGNEQHQSPRKRTHALLNYLDVHFRYEEELMALSGYPDHDTHKSKHRSISETALNLLNLNPDGKEKIAASVVPFINIWLEDHLEVEDKKLGEYLKSKGITSS